MTKAQNTLYWREWGNLTKRCKSEGWSVPERHDLHAHALGTDKSHTAFTNPEFDKVLGVFRSYSQAENLNAQVRQERMPRTRLMHRIQIEQMRLLSVVLSQCLKPEAAIWIGKPDRAPASAFEPDLEAAWNYYVEVSRIHGGPDLAFVSDVGDPTRTDEKSDLELIRDTLDARLVKLRQERVAAAAGLTMREFKAASPSLQRKHSGDLGWSWHDVKMAASVECDCAQCRKQAKPAPATPVEQREEVAV